MQVKLGSNPMISSIELPMNIKKLLIFIEQSSVLQQIELIEHITKLVKYSLLHIKVSYVSVNIEKIVYKRLNQLQVHISDLESPSLSDYLQQEKIGTHIFLIGIREVITEWETICSQVGFSSDVIHKFELESEIKRVFCVKCYTIQKHTTNAPSFCQNCHSQLDVSNHFSKHHNAYLGYIHI